MQEHETTHEEAIVPSSALTQVDDASELAEESGLSEQTAANVLYVSEERHSNRAEDRWDLIVEFDEWAHADWSDYDIVASPIALVGRVEDHSEKAFYVRGAFELDFDLIEDRPQEEVKGEYLTEILTQVDETDTDFIDRIAAAYWPKSAVDSIYVYDGQ